MSGKLAHSPNFSTALRKYDRGRFATRTFSFHSGFSAVRPPRRMFSMAWFPSWHAYSKIW